MNKLGHFRLLQFIAFSLLLQTLILVLIRNFAFSTRLFDQIILSSVLYTLLFLISKKRLTILTTNSTEYLAWVLLLAVSFSFASSASLLNIDRSRSFYVLGWVEDGRVSGSLNEPDLVKVVSAEKSDLAAIKIRLSEQIQRGLMKNENGKFFLTTSGSFLVRLSDGLAVIFKLTNWSKNKD